MKILNPILTEKEVQVIQFALDTHLKQHGLAAHEGVALVVAAFNVPWSEPKE